MNKCGSVQRTEHGIKLITLMKNSYTHFLYFYLDIILSWLEQSAITFNVGMWITSRKLIETNSHLTTLSQMGFKILFLTINKSQYHLHE